MVRNKNQQSGAKTNTAVLPLCKQQRKNLQKEAFKFFWQFSEELEKQTGRAFFKAPKPDDQYRLLVFKTWMLKYKIDLAFIVKHVVKYWIKKFQHNLRHRKFGIGTTIAVLTGQVSEEILKTAITRAFPYNENETEFKLKRKEKILSYAMPEYEIEDSENPTDFISAYAQEMDNRQRRNDYGTDKKKFTKHHYRENPFL